MLVTGRRKKHFTWRAKTLLRRKSNNKRTFLLLKSYSRKRWVDCINFVSSSSHRETPRIVKSHSLSDHHLHHLIASTRQNHCNHPLKLVKLFQLSMSHALDGL